MASRQSSTAASYSTAEVARQLGVSIPTVQRWVDSGFLRAWKTAGGHRRVDAKSVQRVLDSQSKGGVALEPRGPAVSVMIVDDNPDDCDIISALVEAALPDAQVIVLGSGFDALVAMGRAMPDVLITDIVMPHMNGLEMLRHLSTQAAQRPPVIFAVSSRTGAQLAKLGPWPAEVSFLPKPIDPKRFIAAMRARALATCLRP